MDSKPFKPHQSYHIFYQNRYWWLLFILVLGASLWGLSSYRTRHPETPKKNIQYTSVTSPIPDAGMSSNNSAHTLTAADSLNKDVDPSLQLNLAGNNSFPKQLTTAPNVTTEITNNPSSVSQSEQPSSNLNTAAETTVQNLMAYADTKVKANTNIPPSQQDPNITPTKIKVMVRATDTLSRIFNRYQLSYATMLTILKDPLAKNHLTRMRPGQYLLLDIDSTTHVLKKLVYPMDLQNQLIIVLGSEHRYYAHIASRPGEKTTKFAEIKIHQSLLHDGLLAHVPRSVIFQLSNIFMRKQTLDQRLRRGDIIDVMYEVETIAGHPVNSGPVLITKLKSHQQQTTVIHYSPQHGHEGYYLKNGENIEKGITRYPITFKRISSLFTLHRWHPILHRYIRHTGIDLAAVSGSPVDAAGNGVVKKMAWIHGYGNAVIIAHNYKYSTLYGHLSRFFKGLRVGQHVHKGQIIGYVGQTGLATGPHLHYEIRVFGLPQNPEMVQLPNSESIASKTRKKFLAYTDNLLHTFKAYIASRRRTI